MDANLSLIFAIYWYGLVTNNMGLLDYAKKKIVPAYVCDDCKRQLEKNEFIAVIGKTPSTGLSMPVG